MTQERVEFETDPYSLFIFAINSFATKQKYIPRLNKFFEYTNLDGTIQERCVDFVKNTNNGHSWPVMSVIKYLQMNRERVERRLFYHHLKSHGEVPCLFLLHNSSIASLTVAIILSFRSKTTLISFKFPPFSEKL